MGFKQYILFAQVLGDCYMHFSLMCDFILRKHLLNNRY